MFSKSDRMSHLNAPHRLRRRLNYMKRTSDLCSQHKYLSKQVFFLRNLREYIFDFSGGLSSGCTLLKILEDSGTLRKNSFHGIFDVLQFFISASNHKIWFLFKKIQHVVKLKYIIKIFSDWEAINQPLCVQAHKCTRLKRPPLECLRCLRNGLSIITRLACLKTCADTLGTSILIKLWHFCCLSHKRHVHWQNSSSKWGRREKPFTIFKLQLMNIQPARCATDHQLASHSEGLKYFKADLTWQTCRHFWTGNFPADMCD